MLHEHIRLGIAGEYEIGELKRRVHDHTVKQAFAGPLEVPHLPTGDLILGRGIDGQLFRTDIQTLNGHCLVLAGSGAGKTIRLLFIALQLASRVKGLWWFDLRKAEGRKLRRYLRRLGIELKVVPARQMKLNPLQIPDGVTCVDWAACFADVFVVVFGLPPRASKLVHSAILGLYRRSSDVSGKGCPTLFDLFEAVKADRKANAPARQAVLDSLEPVLLSLGPDVLAYHVGWKPSDLANHKIVFEFGGVSSTDANLLLNTLLLSEFTSRLARGVSNRGMDLWICVDEAQRLAAASNRSTGMTDLIGLVRGTGIGLDLSVQSSHDIAPPILSSTANKVIGRCGSATDYEAIGAAMGLTRKQRDYLATHLRPGLFVGQLAEGWRKPFLFEIPRMSLVAPAEEGEPDLGDLKSLPVMPAS